jgi:mitochondrial fission protein ELM1
MEIFYKDQVWERLPKKLPSLRRANEEISYLKWKNTDKTYEPYYDAVSDNYYVLKR